MVFKLFSINILFYSLFLLISFERVFSQEGIVGHTWDWGIPLYYDQFYEMFINKFYVCHPEF